MEIYWSIFATGIIFLAMIINLAAKPKYSSRITEILLLFSLLGGFFIYGYGFSLAYTNLFLAIVRALMSVCGMFVGKNDFAELMLNSSPWMTTNGFFIFFWLVHLAALYTTASAAIAAVGAEALKKLRLLLTWRGDLTIIYGTLPDGIQLGLDCMKKNHMSVLFVAESPSPDYLASVNSIGCLLYTTPNALHPGKAFLSSIGISKYNNRKLFVYALDMDKNKNSLFADDLLSALKKSNIPPERTFLTLAGVEEELVSSFQITESNYGYGFVSAFDPCEQAARVMIQHCHPWEAMEFDRDGKAVTDFDALIIGYGSLGQAVMKSLIMNGQFEGSHFHLTVADLNPSSQDGFIRQTAPGIFENYDIDFMTVDGRSSAIFDMIRQKGDSLKYIAICLSDPSVNEELYRSMAVFLKRQGYKTKLVSLSKNAICIREFPRHNLYTLPLMSSEMIDRMAMLLNHNYASDPNSTAWQDWVKCDYFSRKSSRASADFLPAMIHMSHSSEESILAGNWNLTEQQKENLGRTEHLRWCAFHYCMGLTKMTEEEFTSRSKQYLAEKANGQKPRTRIGKNLPGRTHCCLIPWEELDALSAKENKITGGSVDYKQMDIENVLMLPTLLKLQQDYQ